ncbi:lipid A export permease/ATP-binding protein MsbA [Piscinibacter terrae]|uniref:Lipid A export permease/ATP-binding protein MsbA n=1 Tax=Piscinibacter terrae TaxID=2496871 RepID=A0A3N7HTU1_9BURK|nr:lipid A export permease/ATP-binding protein MsbA [Albitalea terrae]RQP25720.1 lipid A export permease/ATP-binding protein MsbA [Albitalea terrae]
MTSPDLPLKLRIARIAPFFRASRSGLLIALAGSIIGAATEPMIAAFLKLLLDRGFAKNALPLWQVPVAIIGLFGLRGLAGFLAQYGLSWAANRGMLDMRAAMFARLLNAQPALFSRHSASSLVNTLTFEVQTGAVHLVNSLQTLVRDALTLVALMVYLLVLNWQLTLFVALLFPPVALVMRVLSKRLHRLTLETQQATDELAYVVEENVQAWRIVRLHAAQAGQASRFHRVSDSLRRLSIKATVAAATMTPITQVVAAIVLSAVIMAALWQSGHASGRTVGDFVAFVVAMLQLVAPIKHLSEVSGPVTRGLAALERGVHLIEQSPTETGGSFVPARPAGVIELRDVSLQYRDDQAAALDRVTMRIEAGETVALVGPSGAGKTTLVNLLPRFLEPSAGSILLDGMPLREWDMHALRRQFALVSQDVVLFNDTVEANVVLGGDADPKRVTDALRAANLLDFVESLPQGVHTVIGHNGSQLSGGQRQRLAIARAIYKDAPILILDEATSALDSESERLVQEALERLMAGRTSLVIAHRLSTIERADRIVALEDGRVVEQGTHAELLASAGLYARLHALQFKT